MIDRSEDVQRKTKLSKATINNLEKKGLFPKRVLLSPYGRAVGWRSDEVDAWIKTRTQSPERDANVVGRGKPGPGRGHRKASAA